MKDFGQGRSRFKTVPLHLFRPELERPTHFQQSADEVYHAYVDRN